MLALFVLYISDWTYVKNNSYYQHWNCYKYEFIALEIYIKKLSRFIDMEEYELLAISNRLSLHYYEWYDTNGFKWSGFHYPICNHTA